MGDVSDELNLRGWKEGGWKEGDWNEGDWNEGGWKQGENKGGWKERNGATHAEEEVRSLLVVRLEGLLQSGDVIERPSPPPPSTHTVYSTLLHICIF